MKAHPTHRRPLPALRARVTAALLTTLPFAIPALAQQQSFVDAASIFGNVQAAPGGVLSETIAPDALESLTLAQPFTLVGVPLTPALSVDLELRRFWSWGPGTQFVIGTDQGDVPMPAPQVALFRGTVNGDPQSRVFLSVSRSGINAIIRVGGSQYFISPQGAPVAGQARPHTVFDGLSPFAATPPVPFECTPLMAPGRVPDNATGSPIVPVGAVSRVALVAVDADFEMRQLFSNVDDAALYVCELLAAVSVFYETEVDMKLAPSFVRIWDTASDPYNATSTDTQLDQFQTYWQSNMGSVSRNTAHLLSGRGIGGGRAYRDEMCGGGSAYGVSGNLTGAFPRPPQNGSGSNWDLVVVAHELGHNFGSPHTHCYSPAIDRCHTEEGGCVSGTPVCQQGTIMSYCHTCSGGLANIDLTFGPTVASYISSQLVACINPARNPCFVNGSFTGSQLGTSSNPYRAFALGTWYVAPAGTVSIAAGSYPEPMTICQPMVLRATGGSAVLGR